MSARERREREDGAVFVLPFSLNARAAPEWSGLRRYSFRQLRVRKRPPPRLAGGAQSDYVQKHFFSSKESFKISSASRAVDVEQQAHHDASTCSFSSRSTTLGENVALVSRFSVEKEKANEPSLSKRPSTHKLSLVISFQC